MKLVSSNQLLNWAFLPPFGLIPSIPGNRSVLAHSAPGLCLGTV